MSRNSSAHVGCSPGSLFLCVVVVFSSSGRCWYGNVIFHFLKTDLSGVNSSFEVIIFCVMLSSHLDSKSSVKCHRRENHVGFPHAIWAYKR